MKKLLLIAAALLIQNGLFAQLGTWYQVTNTSGTSAVGCGNVTVTSSGSATASTSCASASPYAYTPTSAGAWTFNIAAPYASAAKLDFSGINPGDEIEIIENGTTLTLFTWGYITVTSGGGCSLGGIAISAGDGNIIASSSSPGAGETTIDFGTLGTDISTITVKYHHTSGSISATPSFSLYLVTESALLNVYSLVGASGVYCAGSSVTVGLSGSDAGITYDVINTAIVSTATGTGSAITFPSIPSTAGGGYQCIAIDPSNGCTRMMHSTVTVDFGSSRINIYQVMMDQTICPGSTANISLSGSDVGVSYQLYLGTTPIGSPVSGTGSSIIVGTVSTAGTYTVIATGGCVAPMAGSATITIASAPTVTILGPSTTPAAPSPYFYEIDVTGGSCNSYTIIYKNSLNDNPYCANTAVTKSITLPSPGYQDFYYWWLSNCSMLSDYCYPYTAIGGTFGCDPTTSSPPGDWGIYHMDLISVSGCGCTWNITGGTGGKSSAHHTTATNANEGLTISPNPNAGAFTIAGTLSNANDNKEASIEIVDMTGKSVYQTVAAVNNGQVNKTISLANNIANGMYLVKVTSNNTTNMLKLTLER